jgi:ribokinase
MMRQVDFFMPSREEARRLLGGDDPERAAREFAQVGTPGVVIKLGADGSLVYDKASAQLTHVPIYPAQVIDVTGAGDAYCGGFLAGYLETRNPLQAACYGTVSASFCVENLGAIPAKRVTRAEAEQRLQTLVEKLEPSTRGARY